MTEKWWHDRSGAKEGIKGTKMPHDTTEEATNEKEENKRGGGDKQCD
jgi:hypothetical protein